MIIRSKSLAIIMALSLSATPILAQAASDGPSAPALSPQEAIAIALEAQPGTIEEAELDRFEGRPAYDIEVMNATGDEVEFKVDAETGEILNRWIDDDPANDPVGAAAAGTSG